MAKAVVDVLEAVEVDEEEADGLRLASATIESLLQAVDEYLSVRQARQAIVLGDVREGELGPLALGDVGDHGERARRCSLALQRAGGHEAPDLMPVGVAQADVQSLR